MVGAKEGVAGYMILTRKVAALPVTIVLCLTMSSWYMLFTLMYFFLSLVPGPRSSCRSQFSVIQVSSSPSSCLLSMENLS